MPLAELLDIFKRDADADVRAIADAANAEVARVAAEAASLRAGQIAKATESSSAERRAAADGELASATRRARGDVLAARAAMLDRIRAATEAELAACVASDARLGASLIAAAIACAGGEPGTLRCAPVLVEAARAAAPAGLRVEADPGVTTGVIVELASGTRIDATLATLLAREWPRLACEALAQEHSR